MRGLIPHAPALDGLRGACLIAVLLFHSGFGWMSGGFLGVSTFFTLSGFLITTLLLAEREASGGIDLGRFWERRVRRLAPPALATIALVLATAPLWLPEAARDRLPGDALATLLYAVNWRFVAEEYAYGLLFSEPSPLHHFWSLAIEGQFYLLFPLGAAAALRAGGRRGLAAACLVLTLASIAVGLATTDLADAQHRLYYGTDARAGEILIGALLALAVAGRDGVERRGAGRDRAWSAAGVLAGASVAVAWWRAEVDDAWLYRGGFAAYAVASAVVIESAHRGGPVAALLSLPALRWLGVLSYGAYLIHWPVFLVLDAGRTGLPPAALLALRLLVTIALAWASYRFLELPIRRARPLSARRLWGATAAATGAVALGAVMLGLAVAREETLEAASSHDESAADARSAPGEAARAPMQGSAEPRTRFAMFGDSTALSLWAGLGPWLKRDGGAATMRGYIKMGCGLFAYGERENRGKWSPEGRGCAAVPDEWRARVVASPPDAAIVLVGPWETRNRRAHADAPALALGDPELDAATLAAMIDAIDRLSATGARVIWLTSPRIRMPPLAGKLYDSDAAASDPQRIDRLNELVREAANARPDRARVVDLAAYMRERAGGEFDRSIREDDVHFTQKGATALAREWLGAAVLRAFAEMRPGSAARTGAGELSDTSDAPAPAAARRSHAGAPLRRRRAPTRIASNLPISTSSQCRAQGGERLCGMR